MEWLNYHHLLYFWTVVHEGGLAPAGARLRLAPTTISSQIHALERAFDERLFVKRGRRLALTEMGRVVYRYADEIFGLGRELVDTVRGRPTGQPKRLMVGIADALPKLIVQRLLAPAQQLDEPVRLICREDRPERLLADLAIHELDVVLSDAPVGSGVSVRAYSHLLGECGVTCFAGPVLARRLRRGFPRSLEGAPLLLPTENTTLRRNLDQWLDAQGLRPRVVAEFEDSALLQTFGQQGAAVFMGPTAIENEIERQYHVRRVGRISALRERFYAITVGRRIHHPAVAAISGSARRELFRRSGAA